MTWNRRTIHYHYGASFVTIRWLLAAWNGYLEGRKFEWMRTTHTLKGLMETWENGRRR